MGSFVFRWPYPANDVHVTGTFDDWGKSEQLYRVGDHWEKEVDLPSADEKVFYKFVVDDEWIVDEAAPKQEDGHNNINNVLLPERIKRKPAAAAAQTSATASDVPGAFPETPANEEPSLSVKPIPPTEENKNPVSLPPGAPVPSPSTITSNTIQFKATTSKEDYDKVGSSEPSEPTFSVNPIPATTGAGVTTSKEAYDNAGSSAEPEQTFSVQPIPATTGAGVTTSMEDYEKAGDSEYPQGQEQTFSVDPLPATSGKGNPVALPPGAPVPDSKDITSNTVESTVTTSKEDYEKAGNTAFPADMAAGAVGVGAVGGAALLGGLAAADHGKKQNLIPESSLPMGPEATKALDAGPFISSSGPGTTTAELASKVPLETNPTISSSGPGTTTADLASKVPLEDNPTISSSGPGTTTAGLAAGVPLEKKRQAMVIDPSDAPGNVPAVVTESISAAHGEPEAAASPEAVIEKAALEKELLSKTERSEATGAPASAAAQQSSYYGLATSVPGTVEKSMQEAHAAPEAAADASIVAGKSDVEKELLENVPSTDAAGEPAPTIAAATSATAPAATTSTAAAATSITDGKTANEPIPDTDTSTTAHGATAGEIAGGAAVGGTAAAGAAALAAKHDSADAEPPRVPDSQKPDITTEESPATASKDRVPGQHPAAGAAVADGSVETPSVEVPKSAAPVEKTEGATTEYAPIRTDGAAPGVSSTAAAALSDGTEDPTLSEEPAVKMMQQNETVKDTAEPASATAGDTTVATNGSAGVAASGITPVAGIPSLTSAGTDPSVATEKKDGVSAAADTKPKTPTTPSKSTAPQSAASSPATQSASKEKKKRHRISGFFKKVFHHDGTHKE